MTSPSKHEASVEARHRRSVARLAAVQALYQHSVAAVPTARLLAEFHDHRLGADEEEPSLAAADRIFFDDLVSGTLERIGELDALLADYLQAGWTLHRLDRLMLQILRCGAYELLARPDVPLGAVVSEYADVAHAFYARPETGFVNALLDRLGRDVRSSGGVG